MRIAARFCVNEVFRKGRPLFAMPPKKRARTAANAAANNKNPAQVPQTMADVCDARVQLKDWICEAYQGLHGFSHEKCFPLGKGGSFLEIVGRCWESDEMDLTALIPDSVNFLKKIGILDSSTSESDFVEKHCTMKVRVGQNMCLKSNAMIA